MPASAILRLARTIRWAIAGSATRNARAISAVVRPPSDRSVSATRAGGASAGWQHVKISRRRSSRIIDASSSSGCSCSCRRTSSASRSARPAAARSRRSRSIALRCAVVVIQAAGLAGTPPAGHAAAAAANASCTASSAMPKSPSRRTSVARTAPRSSRKTRSTAAAVAVTTRPCPHTGRTSTDPYSALGMRAAHDMATSRSGASIRKKPARYSFVSAKGPSVTSVAPPRTRTVVAASVPARPSLATSRPASVRSFR